MRAQEKHDETISGLPFLADLALALSVLGCTMLHLLYQGPDVTTCEETCAHLLKSRLLQRCVWQVEHSSDVTLAVPLTLTDDAVSEAPPSSPNHKVMFM